MEVFFRGMGIGSEITCVAVLATTFVFDRNLESSKVKARSLQDRQTVKLAQQPPHSR